MGIAVLCLLLGASTLLRRVLPVLIANILLMGSLTAAHLLAPATGPQALTSALEPGGTPAVLPAAVAGVLSLLALTLLLTRGRSREGGTTEPPAPGTSAPTATGGDPRAHPPSTRQAQVGAVPTWACP
ncbi:hypothetical protein ACFQVA_23025 [Actinomadura keratinilytica]